MNIAARDTRGDTCDYQLLRRFPNSPSIKVIINIAIGIVVIITHVVVGRMVISSVKLIAFVIVIVSMPIAVSSHGRIALTMVIEVRHSRAHAQHLGTKQ